MKKNDRLEAWLNSLPTPPDSPLPREVLAYFACFHAGLYYEAHDVLEHLWLRSKDSHRSLYQGFIQLAGAFVHFQKNAQFPDHPTHSKRLAPGRRLLLLAHQRLLPFTQHNPLHPELDVAKTCALCLLWASHAFHTNPLLTLPPPQLPFLLPNALPLESPPLKPL